MRSQFKVLFFPHEDNNQKPKVLHLSSLSVFIFLLVAFQLFITLFHRVRPGILGFASNIDVGALIELTNTERAKQGVTPLELNSFLSEAARQKAADMFARNYWAHYSPNGTSPWWFFKNVGYNYLYAGENLARDFGESAGVVQAWMASPTHRDNILNGRYKDIGIAVVNGILNGEETTLVVQMFGTPGGVAAIPSSAATKGVAQSVLSRDQEQKLALLPQTFLTEAQKQNLTIRSLISSFGLTKVFDISLLVILLSVLVIDGVFVWKKKLIRLSGKSFIHFSFLAIILAIIILTSSGQIL